MSRKRMAKAMVSPHRIPRLAVLSLSLILLSAELASQGWSQNGPEAVEYLTKKPGDLIDVTKVNPRIVVDMKYATKDNLAKQALYDANVCFLRRSTALKLDAAQKELEGLNLGLKVWDCYRPLAVQHALWKALPDERYVANPRGGSRHNRGSTVDATLVDSMGVELQMPTGFDDFSIRAHRHYRDLPEHVIRNRSLLETSMKKAGFIPLPREWWHYDDEKWSDFEVMDVPFLKLIK